jgi:putative PIN family toxin of toxin-antitoxin system
VSPPLAVIDTNVVVSGVLTLRSESPTALILDAMLQARFRFLLSPAILEEYRSVLLRPKIRARHRLTEKEIDLILTEIAVNAAFREPVSGPNSHGDDHLRLLLEVEPDSVLVTGDRPLFSDSRTRSRVLAPREFVALFV